MESFSYGIAHLISAVEGIDKQMKVWNRNLTEAREDLKIQNQIVPEPFAETEKLKQKRSRYNEVMDILNPPKEEQKLDTDGGDAVQYQQRYRDEDKPKKRKKATYNEAETLFMIWEKSSAPVGEVKRFARFGKFRYYEKTETGAIELSRKQYNERSKYNAQDIDRRAEREIGQVANFNGSSKGNEAGTVDGNRNSGGAAAVLGQAIGEELRDDTGGSVSSSGGDNRGTSITDSEEQYQQRHKVLTNREVLEMAVDELELSDLTPGERSALDIYKNS